MLQLSLRAREGVEIQNKGNPRESHKERDGTGKKREQDSRTWAVYKQGKIPSVHRARGHSYQPGHGLSDSQAMVLPTRTEGTGRRASLGSKMRPYSGLELTDIHKVIPEAGHGFSV